MGGSQALQQVLFFGLLLFGLYFLAIRPQRSRARELGQVQAQLGVGSRVLTSSGISAVVTEIDEETAMLEISPGMTVNFLRSAIVRVLDGPAVDEAAEEFEDEPEPAPAPQPTPEPTPTPTPAPTPTPTPTPLPEPPSRPEPAPRTEPDPYSGPDTRPGGASTGPA